MNIINCTPHAIQLNGGATFLPSGNVARVSSKHILKDAINGIPCYRVEFGEVVGLPNEKEDTLYIVSSIVANATNRKDVIVPATGHPDAIRNEKGQIVSVPGFIVK